MRPDRLVRVGVVGAGIAAICCFTPLLVVLLAGLGLAAWIGWLDLVLLPALAFFLALLGYGQWMRHQSTRS